jgi:hypothetical protein
LRSIGVLGKGFLLLQIQPDGSGSFTRPSMLVWGKRGWNFLQILVLGILPRKLFVSYGKHILILF